ncbi:MAG: DUF58 domain-containing protein [Planctomycetota bacterium]
MTGIQILSRLNPFAWWIGIRRSLTASSVSMLLIGIVSLNIIWGLPWVGVFALMVSMGALGWLASRVFAPQLQCVVSVPSWTRVDDPVSVQVWLANVRSLPCMNLRSGLSTRRARSTWWGVYTPVEQAVVASDYLAPGEELTWTEILSFDRRGLHAVPDVRVESLFPFHLFRLNRRIATHELVAVAPRPLPAEHDPMVGQMESQLHDIQSQIRAAKSFGGDTLHYVGSREYVPGIPVRQWDFVSWARLGKPIVREFSPPSQATVRLIIDTTGTEDRDVHRIRRRWFRESIEEEPDLERLLGLAMNAIETLRAGQSKATVAVTSPDGLPRWSVGSAHVDSTELMTQLAAATSLPRGDSERWFDACDEDGAHDSTIVLSRRPWSSLSERFRNEHAHWHWLQSASVASHANPAKQLQVTAAMS